MILAPAGTTLLVAGPRLLQALAGFKNPAQPHWFEVVQRASSSTLRIVGAGTQEYVSLLAWAPICALGAFKGDYVFSATPKDSVLLTVLPHGLKTDNGVVLTRVAHGTFWVLASSLGQQQTPTKTRKRTTP